MRTSFNHALHDSNESQAALLRRLRETPALFDRLGEASSSEFARQERLRREFPEDLVRAALSLHELRLRARSKFRLADRMWFDRVGLEQSTAEAVSRHKARRFQGRVWDLCCGIGGDAIALADSSDVTAIDLNPAQVLRTSWNAEAHGVAGRVDVRCADVESLPPFDGLVHVDPDRRAGGRGRSLRLEDSSPGLDFLQRLTQTARGGAVKASPASNFGGKFPDAEIELVSLEGECKEATIWFGELAEPGMWRATSLPSGATLVGRPLDWQAVQGPLGRFLGDPDPAVVRAGLVDQLAETSGLSRLDDAEEYMTADSPVASPFVRWFEVLEDLTNNDRAIRGHFRERGYGQVEIKCRHVPIVAEDVRRKLPLGTGDPVTLVFARIGGKTRAIVCRRLA